MRSLEGSRRRFVAGVAAVVVLFLAARAPLIQSPYFDDELGYYIPRALEIFDSPNPFHTLAGGIGGKTPLLEVVLVVCWKLVGYSIGTTRWTLMLLSGITLIATALLARRIAGERAGVAAALFLAACPAYFCLGVAAMPEAVVCTGLMVALTLQASGRRALSICALFFAAFAKVTSLVVIPSLVWLSWKRERPTESRPRLKGLLRVALPFSVPLLSVGLYILSTSQLVPGMQLSKASDVAHASEVLGLRSLLFRGSHRLLQLFGMDYRWLAAMFAGFGVVEICRGRGARKVNEGFPRTDQRNQVLMLCSIIAAYLGLHVIIGYQTLLRYVLPALPPFFVLVAFGISRVLRSPLLWALGVIGLAVLSGSSVLSDGRYGKYRLASYNEHLGYLEIVESYQKAIEHLERHPSANGVAANYPGSTMLSDARLGYSSQSHVVKPIPVSRSAFDRSGLDAILFGAQLDVVPSWVEAEAGDTVARFGVGTAGVTAIQRRSSNR